MISIDHLVSKHYPNGRSLEVKLDVGGMEIDAIKGAERTLGQDRLFSGEDYDKDPYSRVTEFILSRGLVVFSAYCARASHLFKTACEARPWEAISATTLQRLRTTPDHFRGILL